MFVNIRRTILMCRRAIFLIAAANGIVIVSRKLQTASFVANGLLLGPTREAAINGLTVCLSREEPLRALVSVVYTMASFIYSYFRYEVDPAKPTGFARGG